MAESKMPARIWARDLDGTGSMHSCAKGDPGAIEFVPADLVEPLVEALRWADQFITNGIELGFIRMPDPDCPDPAHQTPALVRTALSSWEAPQ